MLTRTFRYRVVGWSLLPHHHTMEKESVGVFDIRFERVDPDPVARILRYPLAEDVDDYKTYKNSVHEVRQLQKQSAKRDSSCELRHVRRKSGHILNIELPKQVTFDTIQCWEQGGEQGAMPLPKQLAGSTVKGSESGELVAETPNESEQEQAP
jgi:hypothetical protein